VQSPAWPHAYAPALSVDTATVVRFHRRRCHLSAGALARIPPRSATATARTG
jgi:hypothetical protein